MLVETDYADACPIATVALEVASTNETLRQATAEVFTDWIEVGGRHLEQRGVPPEAARGLIIGFITSLEGAFVLARSLRSTEPLEVAGRHRTGRGAGGVGRRGLEVSAPPARRRRSSGSPPRR